MLATPTGWLRQPNPFQSAAVRGTGGRVFRTDLDDLHARTTATAALIISAKSAFGVSSVMTAAIN
jgi:hypothetical protein